MKKAAFILVTLTTVLACQQDKKVVKKILTSENLSSQVFTMNSEQDTVLIGKSGTIIHIYKNTFVDQLGEPISGIVTIELKEAITPYQMVLANLTTLSNDEVLQSGGMIYTHTSQNGKEVFIANNKDLAVSIPTKSIVKDMRIYSGEKDTITGQINWVQPKNTFLNSTKDSLVPILEIRENNKPPKAPTELDPYDPRIIKVTFAAEEFPELSQYQNVRFRVSEKSEYSRSDANKLWTSFDLKSIDEDQALYGITFHGYHNGRFVDKYYEVTPALEGDDQKLAIKEYKKKFKRYEKIKKELAVKRKLEDEKKKENARIEMELYRKRQMEQARIRLENERYEAEMKRQDALNNYVSEVNRYYFTISYGGWKNIDKPRGVPPNSFYVDAEIDGFDEFELAKINIILKNTRVLVQGIEDNKGNYSFTNLPIVFGENLTVYATAYKDNKPYYSIISLKAKPNKSTVKLNLELTTFDELKEKLKEAI